LDLLKILINSLKRNILSKNSVVFIFSDGWKNDSDKEDVLNVRKYIDKISGFKKVFIILRPNNFGLSKNIIDGINYVLKKNKKIIVLEEDLELSKYFLNFINTGLKIYQNISNVASIHGYFYPVNLKKNFSSTFFIRGADCWGWGTWRRAWKKFNPKGKELSNKIKKQELIRLFNFNNSYDYFKMLVDQTKKNNNSWAIRWHASMFLENMYTLYPKISLVKNNGTKNGTHSNFDILNLGKGFLQEKYKPIIRKRVVENNAIKEAIEDYFNKNYLFKIKEFLKNFIK
jgi:hypothetical protein